ASSSARSGSKMKVTIYLTDLRSVLRWCVTGRLKLFRRYLASLSFSRFAPFLRSFVDLGLRNAYDLFRKPAESLKGFFVWCFGFLHKSVWHFWLAVASIVVLLTVFPSPLFVCGGIPLVSQVCTERDPMRSLENIDVSGLSVDIESFPAVL